MDHLGKVATSQPHLQAWGKVNVRVDAGIVPLVEALSSFPKLETVESCEGYNWKPAWVCFRYGDSEEHPWKEIAEFVFGYLAPGLQKAVGDGASISLRQHETGTVIADLSLRHESLRPTIDALRDLANAGR